MKKVLFILFLSLFVNYIYSQDRWGIDAAIGSDGVMEVGKYIDFHESDDDPTDYSLRMFSANKKLVLYGNFDFTAGGSNLPGTYFHHLYNSSSDRTVYVHAYPTGTDVYNSDPTKFNWRVLTGGSYSNMSFSGTEGFIVEGKIKSTGNVGIGIEPSNYRLEVKGGDSKFDSDYKVYIPSVGSSYFWRGNTDGVDNLKLSVWYKFGIYNPTSGGINTYNSDWNIRFCARSGTIETKGSGYFALISGNVGIGTTNTGTHKLAVEGSIGAREIKVEASGWADFVFHPNYNLRPLQEVNTYIQQNGHLPEIPTAKEVEENGVNLGEMNAKLLQKIEELTLYVIELQKQVDKQDKLIEQQSNSIRELKIINNIK